METILSYIAIWSPALVAVLGVITTVVLALGKLFKAVQDFKNDKSMVDLTGALDTLRRENEELIRCNKLLLDQITKIKGYADIKQEEKGGT